MVDAFAAAARVAAGIASDADRAWLRAGVATWLRCDGALSLERALGLSGRRRGVLARRDELLLELRDVVGGPEAMLRTLARFAVVEWPRWQGLAAAPAGATYLQRIAFDLMSLNCRLPGTARGLRKAISGRNKVVPECSPCATTATAPSAYPLGDEHVRQSYRIERTARPAPAG